MHVLRNLPRFLDPADRSKNKSATQDHFSARGWQCTFKRRHFKRQRNVMTLPLSENAHVNC